MSAEMPAPKRENICVVIVTYNPDEALDSLVRAISLQTRVALIVDNGSERRPAADLELPQGFSVQWRYNSENIGVAAALNQGLAYAAEHGFSWMLALDQDSLPEPGMVAALCRAYQRSQTGEIVAVVAPRLFDPNIERWATYLRRRAGPFYERKECRGEDLRDVTTVISSGALFAVPTARALGGFREDFFIDYVDTEYCLRARSNGYEILVACEAVLQHRLGMRRKRVRLKHAYYPTYHSPSRWYYFYRNRIPMLKRYAFRFPHWLTYELIASAYTLLRMMLTEDQRRKKLHAALLGMIDGLRGRMGEIPPSYADVLAGRNG